MKKIKYWLACKLIDLCNYGLKFKDAADSQEEVNELIATKNYFIKERDKAST